MVMLSTLEEISDIRKVWPHEALNFTPWLAEDDNIAMLGDALGIEISVDETESPVGDFNVDITATEVSTGRRIIIENQLEDTDHDHLGKIITYASGKDAEIIIWLVKTARPEHRSAIEWLNSHTDSKINFFLCEIKLYKIGNSDPAVKFDVIEKPNDWTQGIKVTKGLTPAQQNRLEYWTAFNGYAYDNKSFSSNFNKRKPSTDHWMSFYIGSSAFHLGLLQLVSKKKIGVEVYIDNDKDLYHAMFSKKDIIENEIGASLEWLELPSRIASRIVIYKDCTVTDKLDWNNQFEWLMTTMSIMKNSFKRFV